MARSPAAPGLFLSQTLDAIAIFIARHSVAVVVGKPTSSLLCVTICMSLTQASSSSTFPRTFCVCCGHAGILPSVVSACRCSVTRARRSYPLRFLVRAAVQNAFITTFSVPQICSSISVLRFCTPFPFLLGPRRLTRGFSVHKKIAVHGGPLNPDGGVVHVHQSLIDTIHAIVGMCWHLPMSPVHTVKVP